jgi:predicted enzyme related to lactoylglutathione lyase
MGAMKLTYNYTRLLVADFAASFRFYSQVLELPVHMRTSDDVYAEFDTSSVTLALFRRDYMAMATGSSGQAEGGERVALTFTVADVDAAYQELVARGAQPVTAPQDRPEWIIRTAHFRDPDGNLIEISAPLPS